ncbi:nuclear transport factor 2 family protein [Flavobacterium aquiphilum]|uniref:nuclear transport factor 2 family protein n=1 Tax=Flavobacterium aquiphilum TaxID=3003261 RepID=UPI002480DE91|nr:nuclear transport factor 2 family protein [Flavobacterium aquiphilum]
MDITEFIKEWLDLSNSYDTENYLDKYAQNAVLNDPSVGRKFMGHNEIREYFNSYFIGYKTQTRLVNLTTGDNKAHLEVDFTGDFPGGQISGMFDFTFKDGKIATAKADLI